MTGRQTSGSSGPADFDSSCSVASSPTASMSSPLRISSSLEVNHYQLSRMRVGLWTQTRRRRTTMMTGTRTKIR